MEAVWTFHCTCFFTSFSSLLIGLWPAINGIGMGFTTYGWRWSFPVRRIRRKVAIEHIDRLGDLWARTIAYVE